MDTHTANLQSKISSQVGLIPSTLQRPSAFKPQENILNGTTPTGSVPKFNLPASILRPNLSPNDGPNKRVRLHEGEPLNLPPMSSIGLEQKWALDCVSKDQKTPEGLSQNQLEAKMKNRILEEIAKSKNPLEMYKLIKQQNSRPESLSVQNLREQISLQKAISDQKNLIICSKAANVGNQTFH